MDTLGITFDPDQNMEEVVKWRYACRFAFDPPPILVLPSPYSEMDQKLHRCITGDFVNHDIFPQLKTAQIIELRFKLRQMVNYLKWSLINWQLNTVTQASHMWRLYASFVSFIKQKNFFPGSVWSTYGYLNGSTSP